MDDLLKSTALYQEFLAEREEILRHKWLESEKAGYDIGFERALLDWNFTYRAQWRQDRNRRQAESQKSIANAAAGFAQGHQGRE